MELEIIILILSFIIILIQFGQTDFDGWEIGNRLID